jgi:hypothetical protein
MPMKMIGSTYEIRRRLLPWAAAALLASFLPAAVLLKLWVFPESLGGLFEQGGRSRMVQIPFPSIPFAPLSPSASRTVLLASLLYVVVGLMLSRGSLSKTSGWRSTWAHVSLSLSVAGLFFLIPMLATIGLIAAEAGAVLSLHGWAFEENHGSWRTLYDVRSLFRFALFIPACSLVPGLASLVLRPSRFAVIVLTLCALSFLGLMQLNDWLTG